MRQELVSDRADYFIIFRSFAFQLAARDKGFQNLKLEKVFLCARQRGRNQSLAICVARNSQIAVTRKASKALLK